VSCWLELVETGKPKGKIGLKILIISSLIRTFSRAKLLDPKANIKVTIIVGYRLYRNF